MQIRQLEHFEAVYRLRSFARAAAEHFVTQSAVSRSIRSLEDELGQRLFDRSTHAVEPTGAADALVHHAQDVLAAVSSLREEAGRLRGGVAGKVRIGTGPYPAQPLMTRAVRRLSASHAGVQVSVAAGTARDLMAALINRDLDFVVCDMSKYEETPLAGEVTIVALPSEPLVVAASAQHPLVDTDPTPEEIAACPWALPTPAPQGLRVLAEPFAGYVASGRLPFYRLETTSACLEIVKDGRSLTLVPLSLALELCPRNGLVFRLAGVQQRTNDGIHLVGSRSRSSSVQLAMDAVTAEAEAIAAESAEWSKSKPTWTGQAGGTPRRK